MVEMIFQRALVATGHEDEFLDPGGKALLHRVLDERTVDDRQHLLRHRLGRGEEAGSQTGNRKNGFSDSLRHAHRPLSGTGLYMKINDLTGSRQEAPRER
jgi:hypothetical protein